MGVLVPVIVLMASITLCWGVFWRAGGGIIELLADLTTSIAMAKTPSMIKKGNKTKNQEMALYPLEHKKFKNQVQAATKITLAKREKNWNFWKTPITMLMEANTKYNMAGVQIFDKSIIQYCNIIFSLLIKNIRFFGK